eukprot:TRINITY_DN13663_c0_g1_i3.p1 TRINITY_DN13663_c0_g1~~TRINITY_DN13663_c0_g1_i3.p1  ORF type:complete len:546 (+),score=125.05 TRINITY_DN13663_c0_g1_i3:85-1722(+)
MSELHADVHTSFGICRGSLRPSGVAEWRGIPFAHVPARFRHSVPPPSWEGVRECSKYGKIAVQPPVTTLMPNSGLGALVNSITSTGTVVELPRAMSEQCLSLNIFAPEAPAHQGELYPVMVFLHGGAFIFGSGSDLLYRSPQLTRKGRVVFVSINYRLGPLGYLNLPGLDANCGLWDQCMALQWVHSEIARFGGDPTNVTICGESAGGFSCGTLLGMPAAQPYFRRAIIMSGGLSNVLSAQDAAACAQRFADTAACSVDDIQALSTEKFLELQIKFANTVEAGAMPWQPCVDPDTLPELPLTAISSGLVDLSHKQIMLGSNAMEWNLFSPLLLNTFSSSPLDDVALRATQHNGAERRAGFPTDVEPTEYTRALLKALRRERGLASWEDTMRAFMTMTVFTAPARLAARELARVAESVWVYEYGFDAGLLGAAHATELPLLFGVHNHSLAVKAFSGSRNDPETADRLSKGMMTAFSGFARDGAPEAVNWSAPYSAEHPRVLVWNKHSALVYENQEAQSAINMGVALVQAQKRPFGLIMKSQTLSKL